MKLGGSGDGEIWGGVKRKEKECDQNIFKKILK